MQKDPKQRLGAKGAWQVKNHPWFSGIDWEQVLARKLAPPFKPYMADEMDVGNFSQEFTSQDPVDSPGQMPNRKYKKIFRVGVHCACSMCTLQYAHASFIGQVFASKILCANGVIVAVGVQ